MSIEKLKSMGGNFVSRLGGADIYKQDQLSKLTPQQLAAYNQQKEMAKTAGMRELSARLSDAFGGRDITGRAAQRGQLIEQQKAKVNQQKLVKDWKLRNPDRAGNIDLLMSGIPESFLTPKPTKGPASYEEYVRTDSTPTDEEYAAFLQKQKESGATKINLDQRKDTIFAQEAARAGFATKKDKQIEQDKQLLGRIKMSKRQLLDGVKTGKVEEFMMPFREFAVGLGIADADTINELGQQELFQATTNFLVPRMRVEGSGSTSDMEIDLFKSAVPNLGRTAAGNLVVAGGVENLAEYNMKRQRLMDKYLKENQSLLGFGEYADKKLGPLYKSYSSDNEFDTQVKQGTLKEGDFVYDAIYKQFRVLTKEDVS